MNRTNDFLQAVRSVKRNNYINPSTEDIIIPSPKLDPFLVESFGIYKNTRLLGHYIETSAKELKGSKGSQTEKDQEYSVFEKEISEVIRKTEKEISELEDKVTPLPKELTDDIIDDIRYSLSESRSLFNSALSSHSNYQHLMAIIEPSISRFANNIQRTQPISPALRRDRVLDSIPLHEKERLLNESVQIEKSLQRELEAVKSIEKNAHELSQLVTTFTTHVAEQHKMVETIDENTQKAKDDVDEGLKHLRKANGNSKGSTLIVAFFVFLCGIILLILHW